MTGSSDPLIAARARVTAARAGGGEALAQALEACGRVAITQAALGEAAAALEEAGQIWSQLGHGEQAGSCLLLAAATFRLVEAHDDARRALAAGRQLTLSDSLVRGFDMEVNEQTLAQGRPVEAWHGFTQFLARNRHALAPGVLAQVLQRRAAAGVTSGHVTAAADDLLEAADIFVAAGHHADSEACRLAAAGVLAATDVARAERILADVERTVPTDGAAATRRGLVGGKVAMAAGASDRAMEQFQRARQGALDVGDPVSYLAASVEASHAAEAHGDGEAAYAELARAWGTLSDLVGNAAAETMVKPELLALRTRLGQDRFEAAKNAYGARRRAAPAADANRG